jgi:hypothetical protein
MGKSNQFYGGLRGNGLREVTREGKTSMRTYIAGPGRSSVTIEAGYHTPTERAWYVVTYEHESAESVVLGRGDFGDVYRRKLPDPLTFGARLHEALSNIAAGCRDPQGVARAALREMFGDEA